MNSDSILSNASYNNVQPHALTCPHDQRGCHGNNLCQKCYSGVPLTNNNLRHNHDPAPAYSIKMPPQQTQKNQMYGSHDNQNAKFDKNNVKYGYENEEDEFDQIHHL